MTAADHNDDIALRAARLYAARSARAKAERSPQRQGVAEILQFLNDPARSLSMEEQRSLFANPRLRADYRRLKSELSFAKLPAMAAAAEGDVNSRWFEGGTVSIHPSRVRGQTYVILRFNWPAPPRTMLLEDTGGGLMKRPLPPPNVKGEVMMVLDEKKPFDARFLRMISDPTSTGSFLV